MSDDQQVPAYPAPGECAQCDHGACGLMAWCNDCPERPKSSGTHMTGVGVPVWVDAP